MQSISFLYLTNKRLRFMFNNNKAIILNENQLTNDKSSYFNFITKKTNLFH